MQVRLHEKHLNIFLALNLEKPNYRLGPLAAKLHRKLNFAFAYNPNTEKEGKRWQ